MGGAAEVPEAGEPEAPKQTKGVGEGLRQLARRIRGDKGGGGSKARAGGQTRGARQASTPRKAGGS